jgi:hypothetical protein
MNKEDSNKASLSSKGNFTSRISLLFRRGFGLTPKRANHAPENNVEQPEERQRMLEYSGLVGNAIGSVAEEGREYIKRSASSYIEEKKQGYAGLAYLEQLEKNYIYLDRCIVALIDHINSYLLGQENAPIKDKVDVVLNEIRLGTRSEAAAHMKYLAFGCDGCDYHADHVRYSKVRDLRLRDMKAYVEEMEFGCFFYKASLTLSQAFLSTLWNQANWHSAAGRINWDKRKMNKLLALYVNHITSGVLNNSPLLNEKGTLVNYVVLNE